MCIFAVALDALPDFPFILAFNRDEHFSRPTEVPRIHEDGLLCAIDGEKGGTWMGVNTRTFSFAALTNVRCEAPTGLDSRGQLVRRILLGDLTALLSPMYASFNLLHGSLSENGAHDLYLSANTPENLGGGGPWRTVTHALQRSGLPEVHVKSNDASGSLVSADVAGEQNWPKAVWLRCEIARLLATTPKEIFGEEGAKAVLHAIDPALSATKLHSCESKLAVTYRARWTNLPHEKEEVCHSAHQQRAQSRLDHH